jgi:WD40 repeat protein
VSELLLRWEEARGRGQALTAEELCRSCPEHREEVRRRLAALEAVYRALETIPPENANGQAGPSPPLPGDSVPGYEILGELGRGGMGVVYQARQVKLNRLVALKMILAGGHAGGEELARFKREVEAIARLQHPHIVQIHEVGEHNGLPFFSLEFCPGGILEKKLGGMPLPAKEAAALVEKLAHAMQAAHQKGVIHRDLKPANVLLGEDGTPKITDFGLAKKLDEAGQTASGAVMGTPSYMAPEQAGGKPSTIGLAADVYALGAVLYECLTGRPPFKAATVMDTLLLVVGAEPVPPGRLNPKVPRDLETICLKCLEKEPARRYGSAAALADELARFLKGEPIQARPVGAAEQLWRWCRRNPVLATVSGLAVAFLVAGTIISALFAFQAHIEAEQKGRIAERLREERNLLNSRLAENYLDRALDVCTKGQDLAHGLLLMCRALEYAPPDNSNLQREIRTNAYAWRRELHSLKAVFLHQGSVSAAFSPDGKAVLTGSLDKTARLWSAATGQPLTPPLRHQDAVWTVAFSSDGKAVLTGSHDGTARLWSATTGKGLTPPLRHKGKVNAAVFSPDGKAVLTASADKTARLWSAATGKELTPALRHQDNVLAVAFSPDGKSVLTGSDDNTARLWSAATGQPLGVPLKHQLGVCAVAFSPDGTTVVTGSYDQTAQVWDVATCKPITPSAAPLRHDNSVVAVAFNPDGTMVLTGSAAGKAQLWDPRFSKPLGPPLLHEGSIVLAVAFRTDGQAVLTRCVDGTVRAWEADTGRPLGCFRRAGASALAFRPDGEAVLTGGADGTMRVWEADSRRLLRPRLLHQAEVLAVAFSPDGKAVLTGSLDKTARLWSAATGKALTPPLSHEVGLAAVAFSPDGKVFLTADGSEARLWSAATRKELTPPLRPKGEVWAVAFSPDGQAVLTATADNTAQLWSVATGRPLGIPLKHQGKVLAMAFRLDGKAVLTGSEDGTARICEVATGKPLGTALRHQHKVVAVAFSPDGKVVLTASVDAKKQRGEVQLWSAAGRPLGAPLKPPGRVETIALSPNGKTVLTANPMEARLWEVPANKPLGGPLRPEGGIQEVRFSPDGEVVFTGGEWAQLWSAATARPVGPPLPDPSVVRAVAFSPDVKTVLTGNLDGSARLWEGPIAWRGDVSLIRLWVQVHTGSELDEHGALRLLDPKTWRERRQRLEKQVGSAGY